MLTIPPVKYRNRRGRSKPRKTTIPTVPSLVLSAAEFVPGGPPMLVLTFDRAIDLAGLDGSAITVRDGEGTGWLWQATLGWEQLDPTSVQFALDFVEEASGPGVILNATRASGIVAVDDGGTWGGATNQALPFPP